MFNRVNSSSPDRAPAVRILLVGNPGDARDALLEQQQPNAWSFSQSVTWNALRK